MNRLPFDPKPLDWATTAGFLAQSAHLWFACAITLGWAFFGLPLWWLWCGAVPLAVVKEFWVDMRLESSATWENQSLDFIVYMAGMILASVVCGWR